mmetsp:Transcript_14036/g.40053  ORF Transcript_14036/g.40053 Transcript_14036/m.40053 type:complete len:418 (-) Transcript_14036:514-1767(-)
MHIGSQSIPELLSSSCTPPPRQLQKKLGPSQAPQAQRKAPLCHRLVTQECLHVLQHVLRLPRVGLQLPRHQLLVRLEALAVAPRPLLDLRPLVGEADLLLVQLHPQPVHLRGVPQRGRCGAHGHRMHRVLRGLGRALRLVQLLGAPAALLFAEPLQLLKADLQASALPLLLRQVLLDHSLLLEDAMERSLLSLHGLSARGCEVAHGLAEPLEVLGSERIGHAPQVRGHPEVRIHHSLLVRQGPSQRLHGLVHLPHQTADGLQPVGLLHAELPDVLVHLLDVCLEVLPDLPELAALALQPLDVLLGVGLALHLLSEVLERGLQVLQVRPLRRLVRLRQARLVLQLLDLGLCGLDPRAEALSLELQAGGLALELNEALVLGVEVLEPLLHRGVLLLEPLDLAAERREPLLVDLPEALLV